MRLLCRTLFCLLLPLGAMAQEANVWYFGGEAGLDFNSGSPVPITNANMGTLEGCASISDAQGNLLFYTNGIWVMNANNDTMPNGFWLAGDGSASQSALIVPMPGNADRYYLFTVDHQAQPDGLSYSIIDMTLDGGLGDVTTKDQPMLSPVTEQLTGIKTCDGEGYWIIAHKWNSDEFYAYPIDDNGIGTPIISAVGSVHTGPTFQSAGYIRSSPNGSKLCISTRVDNTYQIMDFSTITGLVSNPITLPANFPTAYGVEFSPNGRLLYVTKYGGSSGSTILQYDLWAGTANDIINSEQVVGTSDNGSVGALQSAPDGKIYLARPNRDSLGVINNPNVLGVGCGYVDNGLYLGGRQSKFGLPNFLTGFFSNQQPLTVQGNTLICAGDSLNITASGISFNWSTGDTTTTITVTPSTTTTYFVTITDTSCIRKDSVTIQVESSLPAINIMGNTSLCQGQSTTLSNSAAGDYVWSTGDSTNSISVTPAGNTTYSVSVTNVCGTAADSVVITLDATPPVVLTADTFMYGGDQLQLEVITQLSTIDLLWNDSLTLTCTTCNDPIANPVTTTTYYVSVTAANGCVTTDSVMISILDAPCSDDLIQLPNAFSPNLDGNNDVLMLLGGGYLLNNYRVFNRYGNLVFESNDKLIGWDGKNKNGKDLNPGVFVYVVTATCIEDGRRLQIKGNVTLVR